MADSRELIKKELTDLVVEGFGWITSYIETGGKGKTAKKPTLQLKKPADVTVSDFQYQPWYSRALPLVRQILPDRSAEFEELYSSGKRKEIDYTNYGIKDYLQGISVTQGDRQIIDANTGFLVKFKQQLAILQSAQRRVDSAVSDVMGLLRAGVFDDELAKSAELTKNGYLRAGGTLAGVVLEGHLSALCSNHRIKIRKKNPTLSDYNDALKKARVVDTPKWRTIQHLADIRNLCSHAKEREPEEDEVKELIAGVSKVIKNIF